MDPAIPDTGRVYNGTLIYSVTAVDKTLATDAALKIRQAGRVHADGIHWEERIWVEGEFIAFRDHVASLVEVRLSPREELEQGIANGPIMIRNCRHLQARYDHDSEEYADFEGMIEAAQRETASLEEELKALLSSSTEMASAAR